MTPPVFGWPAGILEVQVVSRRRVDPSTDRLVDFAVVLQLRPAGDDAWIDELRVDCEHGFVHVDRNRGGRTVKDDTSVPPECRNNLDLAYGWAQDLIWATAAKEGS